MTEPSHEQATQQHPQPIDTSLRGLDIDEASEKELDRLWAEFSKARASLAEVMSDDELRSLGFNLEVLDQRP